MTSPEPLNKLVEAIKTVSGPGVIVLVLWVVFPSFVDIIEKNAVPQLEVVFAILLAILICGVIFLVFVVTWIHLTAHRMKVKEATPTAATGRLIDGMKASMEDFNRWTRKPNER